MKNAIKAALAAVFMATSASAGTVTLTSKDLGGGFLLKRWEKVQKLNEQGHSVRLDARTITSAGTLYLALDDVCVVDPNTMFRFHGPQSVAGAAFFVLTGVPTGQSFMSAERAGTIREAMAEIYDSKHPGLGDWFLENAAHKAGAFHFARVRAHELNRAFGVEICDE